MNSPDLYRPYAKAYPTASLPPTEVFGVIGGFAQRHLVDISLPEQPEVLTLFTGFLSHYPAGNMLGEMLAGRFNDMFGESMVGVGGSLDLAVGRLRFQKVYDNNPGAIIMYTLDRQESGLWVGRYSYASGGDNFTGHAEALLTPFHKDAGRILKYPS